MKMTNKATYNAALEEAQLAAGEIAETCETREDRKAEMERRVLDYGRDHSAEDATFFHGALAACLVLTDFDPK